MAICVGCKSGVKSSKALRKMVNGSVMTFCCEGCMRLYDLKHMPGIENVMPLMAWL